MKITVNGKAIDFVGTIQGLIDNYKLKKDNIVVERNGEIVHREKYATEKISEGDKIELVRFVGGG